MISLQYIDCKKCNAKYLVGIDGKDIQKRKHSGGNVRLDGKETSYISIGNDEMESASKLNDTIKCVRCGTVCVVLSSFSKG